MSASWSRPISWLKSIRGITSGNRKKHGRRRTHGFAGAAGLASGDLSHLHSRADAGPGVRPSVSTPVDGELPALLPPLVLPDSRLAGAPHRAADPSPAGAVCRQSHL